MYRDLTKLTLFSFLLCFMSCGSPKDLPVIKDLILSREKEMTKKTDEAISKSATLKEIDTVCNSIPLMDGFSLIYKNLHLKDRHALSFAYYSEVKFTDVERFYFDYFSKNGWKLAEKGGVSSEYFIFEKGGFKIGIYYADSGDGVNYLKECETYSR